MHRIFEMLAHLKGGCTDSSAQVLAATFMALCDKDVSKFLFGPLTIYRF
jgi:hypothetical protein